MFDTDVGYQFMYTIYVQNEQRIYQPIEHKRSPDKPEYHKTNLEPHHTHYILYDGDNVSDFRFECKCQLDTTR